MMMNQAVKTQTTESFDAIKEAHNLSGDSGKIGEYYDKWSGAYDRDVSNEAYAGPEYIVNYFASLKSDKATVDSGDRNLEILDAGCGTGLVGIFLKQKGYRQVDGFDLSEKMVEKAQATDAYRTLNGGIDMTQKNEVYKDNQYDAILCCGVFTLGHVPPDSLSELIRIAKPGGLIVVSTRKSYYDSTDFQAVCDRFVAEGKIKRVSNQMDGPYIAEEGAHYWAFAVC